MFKNLSPTLLGLSGHQSEIIELALTYGFKGLDLDIVEFARRAEKHGMPYARRLIDSARNTADFQLGSFVLPLDLDCEDDAFKQQLTQIPQYTRVAAEIGCSRCLAMVQPAGDTRPYHENFEQHKHRLNDLSKVLEPTGTRIGLGFRAADDLRKGQAFQFIHELEALTLLVKMVDAPNVGMLLDTWDLYVSGASPDQVRELVGHRIVAVRVADQPEDAPADEVTEAARILPCATGRIDVAGYLKALSEIGFDGPVTLAPSRKSLQGMRRDPIVQRASKVMAELWQAAGLTPEGKIMEPAES